MIPIWVLLILGAYLLGSVPIAYVIAKLSRGIDLRQYGSGNVGVSNLLKVTSKWLAIPVIIFDLGKGALVVWVAQLLEFGLLEQVTVGLAAIIGHNWPVFLRFSGGRGVLTVGGVVLMLSPWLALGGIILTFIGLPFGLMALTNLLALTLLPISSWFLSEPLGVQEPLLLTLGLVAILLIVIIRRLTAPKTSFTDSVSRGQLLVNRLFWDRDIRDRKAWVNQKPSAN